MTFTNKQKKMQLPAADMVTQFRHAKATRKRAVVFVRHPERNISFTMGPFLLFLPAKSLRHLESI